VKKIVLVKRRQILWKKREFCRSTRFRG